MRIDFLRRIISVSGIVFTVLLNSQLCLAQEPDQSTMTLKVSAHLVVLDVVVTDKDGRPRTDLKADDFKVTEGGVPQSIVSFEPPSEHKMPSGPPINSTADLQKRAPDAPVTIIVLDEINTRFEDIAFARYSLKKYLNAQPIPLPAPTMLLAASLNRFQVLQDYTQDREAVLKALDHHLTDYPWRLQAGNTNIEQLAVSLSALEEIAQSASGHPGRKNIVWVGKGFPGIDMSSTSLTTEQQEAVSSTVQQAVNILRDSRVTLYSIDPSLTSPQISNQDDLDDKGADIEQSTLVKDPFGNGVAISAMAQATGGRAFSGRNDVDKEMAEGARDAVSYYTIAYRPTDASDASQAYRDIHVRVDVPKMIVDYRKGYFSGASAEVPVTPKSIAESMDAASETTLVYTGLDVGAVADPRSPNSYIVGVPERQLSWTTAPSGETANLELLVVALDSKNRVLRRSSFDVVAKRDTTGALGAKLAKLETSVPSVSGTVRVRFVVRSDADGRIGTADLTVQTTKTK